MLLVTNIDWDLDNGDTPEMYKLPSEVEIDELKSFLSDDKSVVLDRVADYLSDSFGFCVRAYTVEEIEPETEPEPIVASEKATNVYTVPVSWTVAGELRIAADSLEEALDYAEDHAGLLPFPKTSEYVWDSFVIDRELAESYNA